jgi:SAM-dependent methyltransferase
MIPDPHERHFIDIGCGKGRPLLIATEFDFRAITGIEFSPPLAWMARRNAAIYARAHPHRARIDIVTGDALDYRLPKEKLALFLYNSFERSLIARLLANLEASLRESRREIYVVYCTPVFADMFDASASLERRYSAQVRCDLGEIGYGNESDTVVIWQNRGNPKPPPSGREERVGPG